MNITSPIPGTLSVAQLNIWNMFDTVDDPRTRDMVIPMGEYRARLDKLALTITATLGSPDILSLNEIENQNVLDAILNQPSIKALGYKGKIQVLNDGRGIRTAIMYRGSLELLSTDAPNPKFPPDKDRGYGQIDTSLLYSRPPLVANFRYTGAGQSLEGVSNLTVIVNHFKSKLGGEKPEPRRQRQGEFLGEYIDKLTTKDPNHNVIVIGDLNATYDDGAYKKLAYRKDGSERLRDTLRTLSDDDRYTYIYRGQKNLLDHIMVTGGLFDALKSVRIDHINTATNAKSHKLDPKVVAGISDHDPIVAVFQLSPSKTAQ